MGTRCLTRIRDGNRGAAICCTIYTHSDGYPTGHGMALAEFLQGYVVVNGLSTYETDKLANGMGCLAAQIVKHLKQDAGHTYLYPCKTINVDEDYIYNIFYDDELKISVDDSDSRRVFEGTIEEFIRHYSPSPTSSFTTISIK